MSEKSVSTESLAVVANDSYTGKRLRIAIIGCGAIAQVHMGALKAMPEAEVVAAVDINPDRLKTMQKNWGLTRNFSDWRKMLAEVKPQAVIICTPNAVHAQPAIDSSNAKAHVMVEKPMALESNQCKKMIDAAAKNRRKLAAGFQYRFHPNSDFLVRARDGGHFGDVMFVKCQALRRRGIPNWGVFGRKELQGGGPMIDIGVHVIEMAHYVMGSPKPVAASGNVWTYLGNKKSDVASHWPNWDYKTYTVEDLAVGQIRFENGAILQIEASFVAHIEKDIWNFVVMGRNGGATWDPPAIFGDRAGTMLNSQPAYVGGKVDFAGLFSLKLRNFVDACLNNATLRAPGEAGMAVQTMLDGIYRSAAKGKEVVLD